MKDLKRQLEDLKRDLTTKKYREEEAGGLMETIGSEIKKQLSPAVEGMGKELTSGVVKAVTYAVKGLSITAPEQQFPEIPAPVVNVPAPVVNVPAPVVNVPAPVVNIPETKLPEYPDFPTEFSLRGVDKMKPLPVMMMDMKGKPAQFGGGGATGGRGDFFTIKDIQTSSGSSIIDNDGFVKVTGSFNVTSSPFATYYASDAVGSVNIVQSIALETRQVSGAIDSMYITGAAASTFQEIMNPDGRVKVELPTGSSGLTDTELRASPVPVLKANTASGTTAAVSVGADASTNIAPSNSSRKSIIITHTSSSNLYIATGTASSASSFPLVANQIMGFDDYTGPVNAIADPQAGSISVRYIETV